MAKKFTIHCFGIFVLECANWFEHGRVKEKKAKKQWHAIFCTNLS